MPYQIRARWFAPLLLLSLLAGCAGTPPAPTFKPPVYPAPPDQARYIYERTLRVNEDVEQLSGFARWRELATGHSEEIRGLVKPYGLAARRGRVYDGDGGDRRTLGSDAELRRPVGVAVSPDGTRLYVVDIGGVDSDEHRVQVLDTQSGQLLQTIGRRGIGDGEFNLPVQAATAPDGTLYVVDGGNFRVQAFTGDGHFRFAFGEVGRFPGQFARPKGIATDASGNIYVVDAAFGNMQIFNPQGQVLMFIGTRDKSSYPGKFYLPAGVAVDETGRVYIADQYFRKIDIFRPVDNAQPNPMAGAVIAQSP